MSNPYEERRRHRRLPLCWQVSFPGIRGGYGTTTCDVSLGGVAIQCNMCENAPPASGNVPETCPLFRYSTASSRPLPLRLDIRLPDNGTMQTEVHVVHAQGQGGREGHVLGAAFLEMSCADFDRLSSALAASLTEEPERSLTA